MRRTAWSSLLLLAIVLIIGAILLTAKWPEEESPPLPSAQRSDQPRPPAPIFSLKGFSSTQYAEEKLLSRITAEELIATPRKFGIFKINSVYDLTLVNAQLEHHLGSGRPPAGFDPFAEAFALAAASEKMKQIGSILKRSIDGLELLVYRDGRPDLRVKALKTVYDAKSGRTRLEKVIIEHLPSQRKIAGHKALWNPETLSFRIEEGYLLETPQGTENGRGLGVRLDFQLRRF